MEIGRGYYLVVPSDTKITVADLTVTKTADTNDGTCDADCSLREAITAANANSGTDTIAFDISGAGPHTIQPTSELPLIGDPVTIDGFTQPGASPNTNGPGLGLNTVLKIELDGSATTNSVGLLPGANSTIRGLAINRFVVGIKIGGPVGNVIEGNFIGTDVTGNTALGNQFGVHIFSGANNTIGGTPLGAANLISGNTSDGVLISGGTSTGNLVQGNFIGTNVAGSAALGNAGHGIVIDGAAGNTIGGTTVAARNIISGNAGTPSSGVFITGSQATGNALQGNYIGTDVNGTVALANTRVGVVITNGASNNTVGGATAGARNVISGNGTNGIAITVGASGNLVLGNFIGVDMTAASPLGNGLRGVSINASDNIIGGTSGGEGNIIAFNGGDAVFASGGTGNAILSNSIFSNTGIGIDLGADGATPNDTNDPDVGANNLQNFPDQLHAFINVDGNLVIAYLVDSTTSTSALPTRAEFFVSDAGGEEGKTFIGSHVRNDFASVFLEVSLGNSAALGVASGDDIVATATDANNTSEFSQTVQVTLVASPIAGLTTWGLIATAGLMATVVLWQTRRKLRREQS